MRSRFLALARVLRLTRPDSPLDHPVLARIVSEAVASGLVRDEDSAVVWIGRSLREEIAETEGPVLLAAMRAWEAHDIAALHRLNAGFLALLADDDRRAESVALGDGVIRVMLDVGWLCIEDDCMVELLDRPAFPVAWGFAAASQELDAADALGAYAWAWLEAQVAAITAGLHLDQTHGRAVMDRLASRIPEAVRAVVDAEIASLRAPQRAVHATVSRSAADAQRRPTGSRNRGRLRAA